MSPTARAFGRAGAIAVAGAIVVTLAIVDTGSAGDGASAGTGDGLADFAWTMPSRFGHHLSGSRLLDYPQSAAEVDSGPFTVAFQLRAAACRPGVERHWAVGGSEVDAEPSEPGCAFRLSFEREGAYDVELHVQGNGADDTSKQRVVVQDLLIVAIGDSVASGEGNPDHGSLFKPVWQNKRCHRSSLAGTAVSADHMEDADPKSSVTFVHLACSGATVPKGLVKGYRGAQPGRSPRPELLPPQLEELQAIARKREIDAVLLSVGGNDVGFAAIVSFCITQRPRCQEKRIEPERLDLEPGPKLVLDDAVKATVTRLDSRFDDVEEGLPEGLPRERVYALEYFDATHRTRRAFCDTILHGPFGTPRGVSQEELRWAYEKVMVPLNERVRAAAQTHDWRYVRGVADAFAGHGYCADESWVRRISQSLRRQGLNYKGTLHPNEEGHARTADLIDALLRPALFPRGVAREPLSPEEQDAEFPAEGVVPDTLVVDEGSDGGDDWVWWVVAGAAAYAAAAAAVFVLLRRRRKKRSDGDQKGT